MVQIAMHYEWVVSGTAGGYEWTDARLPYIRSAQAMEKSKSCKVWPFSSSRFITYPKSDSISAVVEVASSLGSRKHPDEWVTTGRRAAASAYSASAGLGSGPTATNTGGAAGATDTGGVAGASGTAGAPSGAATNGQSNAANGANGTNGADGTSKTNIPYALIGGIVGAVLFLALIGFIVYRAAKKNRQEAAVKSAAPMHPPQPPTPTSYSSYAPSNPGGWTTPPPGAGPCQPGPAGAYYQPLSPVAAQPPAGAQYEQQPPTSYPSAGGAQYGQQPPAGAQYEQQPPTSYPSAGGPQYGQQPWMTSTGAAPGPAWNYPATGPVPPRLWANIVIQLAFFEAGKYQAIKTDDREDINQRMLIAA
ncbi:hypothetical protein HDU96_001206 [Phlyctochytrium bullatum]|nr:hypothetical protein HDU96_001206 [Phlyctochytrium bullatum]